MYFERNLRMYEETRTYLFKPMQRLHWTESQALADASGIIADTLQPILNETAAVEPMLGSPASNAPEFREAFVRKCHRLVGLAYLRLDRPSLQTAEETEITGELARTMEELLERIPPPRGMRNLVVFDDPPQIVSPPRPEAASRGH